MWLQLAHRVGRSSQATPAAVDKFQWSSNTKIRTSPSHANLQRFWMIAGNKRLLLDFMVPACQHCAMGVGCLAKPVACRAKSVDGHRPVADLRRSNLVAC